MFKLAPFAGVSRRVDFLRPNCSAGFIGDAPFAASASRFGCSSIIPILVHVVMRTLLLARLSPLAPIVNGFMTPICSSDIPAPDEKRPLFLSSPMMERPPRLDP